MWGIAGWVSYDGDRTQRDVIATMTNTMAPRGPDAGGVWINRHVGLGHRRLAVIDLAGGVQPMQKRFGTVQNERKARALPLISRLLIFSADCATRTGWNVD